MTAPTDPTPTDPPADPPAQDPPKETDWKAEAQKWESRAKLNKKTADENSAAAKELADLKAASSTDQEKAVAAARKEERDTITSGFQKRILRSEIRALAGGRFVDPADAVAQLDLAQFTPNSEGDFDEQAITSALDELLKRKPYLAAKEPPRFQGGGDQGPRGGDDRSLDQQIKDAESKGEWSLAGALKAKKLSELPR